MSRYGYPDCKHICPMLCFLAHARCNSCALEGRRYMVWVRLVSSLVT